MPNEHIRTAVVGGTSQTVRRYRAVWMITDFGVAEMSAPFAISVTGVGAAAPLGIAQANSRWAPGTPYNTSNEAGDSGDEILVYTSGAQCRAEAGGTIEAGAPLTAGSDARLISASAIAGDASSIWILGFALEAATAGQVFRMNVRIHT